MGGFIAFVGVTGAIIAALGLALALEFAVLYGVTSLMPMRRQAQRDVRS